ncbi:MAG: nickel-dependent hydrogenase large subunit [Armatimonadetes bacterium]|nr:nickel-dependent hydrogenase large subunit [Armatimonadota bacterium]
MAQRTVIPFGPQHPVLPEPIQLKLTLKDEIVEEALPHIGYVHRGVEKAAERMDYTQNVFLVERICGICSFIHALCYCQGLERLMGLEVPRRAAYLRVIWSELHRLQSHHLWLGLYADAFGFESLFMEFWRSREMLMDIFEKTAGSRVIISACCIGGVRRDISDQHLQETLETLKTLEAAFDKSSEVMLNDYTVKKRTVGKGVLQADKAIMLGAAGPVLRASGVEQDARQTGFAAYDELRVEPVVETAGDCYARAKVRIREVRQSLDLVRRAIAGLPDTDIAVRPKGRPNGRTISRVEQPRGELLYFLAANGSQKLERLRVRTPTFANVAPLVHMLPGSELADVPVIVLSIDPCISCTER